MRVSEISYDDTSLSLVPVTAGHVLTANTTASISAASAAGFKFFVAAMARVSSNSGLYTWP